jgi:hypothetical protein
MLWKLFLADTKHKLNLLVYSKEIKDDKSFEQAKELADKLQKKRRT